MDILALCLSVFFGIAPMVVYSLGVRWFDRYEKEPWLLLIGTFLWGAVLAAGAAFIINTVLGIGIYMFTGSETASDFSTGVLVAPIVEETLKGLAVLAVFLLFRREGDSVLDGILYASMVGFGFAATENIYYIFARGYLEGGMGQLVFLTFIRVIVVAFQHGFYTSFTGIGFAVARLSKNPLAKFGAPLLGYGFAMLTHSIHNLLASLGDLLFCVFGSVLDWTGVLAMVGLMIYLVVREGRVMAMYLREEVGGALTEQDYRVACSFGGQMAARWGALGAGMARWQRTRKFLDTCGELAFKKWQLARFGDERGNSAQIAKLRAALMQMQSAGG